MAIGRRRMLRDLPTACAAFAGFGHGCPAGGRRVCSLLAIRMTTSASRSVGVERDCASRAFN